MTPVSHYALLSLFFFAGLEAAFAVQRLVYVALLVLIAIVIAGIFAIRYEEVGFFSPYQAILPSLAVLGLATFSLFLPVTAWLHLYLAGAAVCTYFVLKQGSKQAYPTWNTTASLITLFVVLATIIGARFHFYIPVPALLVATFLVTLLLAVQFYLRYTDQIARCWLLGVVTALAMSQIVWALQFLPLHYLVQTGIALAIYYVGSGLVATSFERTITRREVIEYFVFGGIATAALLITARWQ